MKKLIVCLLCISMLSALPVSAEESHENEAVISVSVPSFHVVTVEITGNAVVSIGEETGDNFQVERLSEPVLEVTVPKDEILVKAELNGEDILDKLESGKYQLPPVYENLTVEIETAVPSESAVSFKNSGYTVRLNTGGDITLLNVGADGKVTLPETPVKKGYNFMGWYTDREYTKKFDPLVPVAQDFMLYAKWVEKTYKVTVKISGDTDAIDSAELNLLKDSEEYQSASGTGTGSYSFDKIIYGAYDLDVNIKSHGKSLHHSFSVSAADKN